jgi:multidrug transporter EmrE-like cation transporter
VHQGWADITLRYLSTVVDGVIFLSRALEKISQGLAYGTINGIMVVVICNNTNESQNNHSIPCTSF